MVGMSCRFTLQANADVRRALSVFWQRSPQDASPIIRRILARHRTTPRLHVLQVMVNR